MDDASWSAAIRRHKTEAALFGAGIFLRFLYLGSRSLWFDEAKSLIVGRAPLNQLLPLVRGLEGVPPFYFLLLHFWILPFQDPLLPMRLFSALCSVAALGVYWRLCLETVPENASFAFFVGCVSSFWLHIAQDGRSYSLFLLLALVSGLLWVRWLRRGSNGVLAAYVAAAAAGLYTHTFFSFLLLTQFLYGLVAAPRERRAAWLGAHVFIALLFLPWLPSLSAQMRLPHTAYLTESLDAAQLGSVVGNMFFDISFLDMLITAWLRALGWAALALIAAAALLRWRGEGKTVGSAGALCAFQFLFPLALLRTAEWFLHRPLTHPRYLSFISPWLYLGLSWSLAGGGRFKRAALLACEAVLVAGAVGYHTLGRTFDPALPGFAESIRRGPDQEAPLVHLSSYYYLPLRYYYLPEREHRLLCPDPREVTWSDLPGYAAPLDRSTLQAARRYIVVDPARRSFPSGLGSASGRELAELTCP